MIASLTVTKGTDHGKVFQLHDGDSKVIGRSSRADITLQEASVSRQHCRVWVAGGAVFVNDLNSKNGTSVNGRRISGATTLGDGDSMELGTCTLVVRVEEATSGTRRSEEPGDVPPGPAIEAPPLQLRDEPAAQTRAPRRDSSGADMMGAFEPYLAPADQQPGPPRAQPEEARELTRRPPPPRSSIPSDDLIGRTVAGYRIEEVLGHDAIGTVYRGLQISMERPVTLKILSPRMTHDAEAVERFIRAARSGGKLNHPNIVQVFDAGEDQGLFFIALELVDGRSVRELLAARGTRSALHPAQALDIAAQAAEALDYVHSCSCVHGSITPDNVLVTGHGIVKLANLGHMRDIEESGLESPIPLGETPEALPFVAPEVLSDPRAAGPLADIYSLGAVLFFMLSGQPPFRGRDDAELIENIRAGRHAPLRRLQRNLPEDLGGLIEGVLAVRPERRPQRAGELARDLRLIRERLYAGL